MPTAAENQVTTPADEVEADAEAERLFAEAAAEREGTQVDGPADQTAAAAAPKPDDGQPGEPGSEEPGTNEGAAAPAPAPGSGEFDWANADSAARAAHEAAQQRFEHQLKSANGRVSVLDRKLNELRKGTGGGEAQEQPRKPLKELLDNDQVKTIGEEYPDFQPVLEALREVANRVDGVSQEVGQVRATAVQAATSGEEKALVQAVPNWLDLARDERFLGWVDDQPKADRDAVTANWDAITNATEAARVFQRFADHIGQAKPDEGQGGGSSKRDRQSSSARAAKVTAPAAAAGESDDAEVAWKEAAAKADRSRGLRT
jgi:hypothetical protein